MSLSPRRRNRASPIKDWAGVVSFTPNQRFAPHDLNELTAILTNVLHGKPGNSLAILGSHHSCSGIFQSNIILETNKLPVKFTATPLPNGLGYAVAASAYMRVGEFLSKAAELNLSLTSLGGTDAQTLAGLISTNTAGATSRHGIYEIVDWVEYLTVAADKQSIEFRRALRADPEFRAVICSLGAIGFLTRIGFSLVEERFYEGTFEIKSLKEVLTDVAETSRRYEFWRIEWIPKHEQGLFWSAKRLPPDAKPTDDYPPDIAESILKWSHEINGIIFRDNIFYNAGWEAVYGLLLSSYQTTTTRGPMRNIIPCDRHTTLRVAMAEWSFDPADLGRVMTACRTYFGKNRWPNLPIEIECAPIDNYLMSPWNWPDLGTSYIMKFNFQYLVEHIDDRNRKLMLRHLEGLWKYLEAEGIPFKAHWAKINFLTPEIVARNYDLKSFMPYVQPMFLSDSMRGKLIGSRLKSHRAGIRSAAALKSGYGSAAGKV